MSYSSVNDKVYAALKRKFSFLSPANLDTYYVCYDNENYCCSFKIMIYFDGLSKETLMSFVWRTSLNDWAELSDVITDDKLPKKFRNFLIFNIDIFSSRRISVEDFLKALEK